MENSPVFKSGQKQKWAALDASSPVKILPVLAKVGAGLAKKAVAGMAKKAAGGGGESKEEDFSSPEAKAMKI